MALNKDARRGAPRAEETEPAIHVRGARENNLRAVDIDVPRGRWIAVTGPSGSGKTSLVFDVIVREGQRRFLGALSARARQYLGKLGRADVGSLTGLPATIAVGQGTLTRSARSTVGTRTGIVDVLRLLFARTAVDPEGVALTRSHFSFNHPLGSCEACQGLGVEDEVDPALLVADPTKSIRDGALVPTLRNGYTVYSQVTLEVMDQICRAHGFDVHTPWSSLTEAQRKVILYGTKKLVVPFGKHSIESRMKWQGITARPREEGYYRGLVPVIEETLARNRNPNILRFVRSVACRVCGGSRLGRPGREARLGSVTLPQLCRQSTTTLTAALDQLPPSPVWAALEPSVRQRLSRMERLGLGHLALDRSSTTLSGGEAQRVRLVAQLTAGLSGMLVALDEPTLGLHPQGQEGMRGVLDELVELGNTLVVVEHDPDMVRHADWLVQLGPGAGPEGGEVVFEGPPPPDPLGGPPVVRDRQRHDSDPIVLRGATLHNLRDAELVVHRGAFNVVVGRSGAGKSSLVFGTLLPALLGQPGGPYASLTGGDGRFERTAKSAKVGAIDARPIGRTPRSTPATWSGLMDGVRKRFAATDKAKALGFGAGRFSYNNAQGRCAACEGLGTVRIGLHLLADAHVVCGTCGGRRYNEQTLAVTLNGLTIADVLALSVREAVEFFADDPPALALCTAMDTLGLGYLQLGQSSGSLSRGEAQRIKLATVLGKPAKEPALLLLDEPDRGLHPTDVVRLLGALDALTDAGHTVLAISHHRHVWAAADHITELREGAVVPKPNLSWAPLSTVRKSRPATGAARAIELRGVRTHHLANIDVDIPRGALTVVAGVSGSGKTSLAFDTLAAEARHRFDESLPFEVRRYARQMPRPTLDHARGLGPTLALRQGRARAGRRSTVATQSELGPLLRLLWSRIGRIDGRPCGLTAEHFSPDRPLGACPDCEGLGTVARCDPTRLVTDATRSLLDGAMGGTKAGRFFTEPDGQYMATLAAVLPEGVDLSVPWASLSESTRRIALSGAGDRIVSVRWKFSRGKRSGEHSFEGTWDGLLALVEREAQRRAKGKQGASWTDTLVDRPCPACGGQRLQPVAATVRIGDTTLPQLMARPVLQLGRWLESAPEDAHDRVVFETLGTELRERVADLVGLGLGHLQLDRRSPSLSDGELARVRLASVLHSGLADLTLVLDEPSAGLHAQDVQRLIERLSGLCSDGNTVVVVAHRPAMIRAAEHLIELGPGAGVHGGHVVAAGSPKVVLARETATAVALRAAPATMPPTSGAPLTTDRLQIRGAHVHNLRDLDVSVPSRGVVAVSGVSGSGKSSLLFDVIEPTMRTGAPVGCVAIEGHEHLTEVRSSRAVPQGACPATILGLMPAVTRMFAAVAKGSGLSRSAFSFMSPAGRCERCKGSGREVVSLDVLADLALVCPQCDGRRYRPEVLAVRWEGLDVAELLQLPAEQLHARVPAGPLRTGLDAMIEVGLGHLSLDRRRAEMSGGELQRLTLAAALAGKSKPSLYLLDEPATGLHEADVIRLLGVLARLVEGGSLIIAAEHRLSFIAAADWVVDLGPGGGPDGGRCVAAGPPSSLSHGATADALQRHVSPG